MASDNFIRVFRDVQHKSDELRTDAKTKIAEQIIDKKDLEAMKDDANKIDPFGCRTDEKIIYPTTK